MTNLRRVTRISRLMWILCTLATFAIPTMLAAMWMTFDLWAAGHPELAGIQPVQDPMPTPVLAAGFLISMLPGGIAMFAAWRLRALFSLYAEGRIFTADNSRCLKHFAMAVMAIAVVKPVATALLSVVLTLANPPGERMMMLRFGSPELTILFIGGVFLIIAWVMEEGRTMAEDQAQIV